MISSSEEHQLPESCLVALAYLSASLNYSYPALAKRQWREMRLSRDGWWHLAGRSRHSQLPQLQMKRLFATQTRSHWTDPSDLRSMTARTDSTQWLHLNHLLEQCYFVLLLHRRCLDLKTVAMPMKLKSSLWMVVDSRML